MPPLPLGTIQTGTTQPGAVQPTGGGTASFPIWVDEMEHPVHLRNRINAMEVVRQLNLRVRGFNGPEEWTDVTTTSRAAKYTVLLELDRTRTTQVLHARSSSN